MERPEASHSRANIPVTRIHPNDLKVLENVLKMYLLYLRRSYEEEARIQRTQRLHRRLKQLLASPQSMEGACIPFTEQELRTINEALSGYTNMICYMIVPSPQRTEVLEALQGLQQQFTAMLSAYLN
jgi:hypothetical protein